MKLLHQGNQNFRFFCPTNLDFPIHLHNAMEMVVLTSGRSTVLYGSERISLRAGDIFIAFPNQVHGYENSLDVRGYLMIIPMNPYLAAYHSILDQKVPTSPVLRKGQWEHTGVQQLIELAHQDHGQTSKHVMQGYLLVIIGKLLSLLTLQDSQPGCADALRSALIFINKHYREPLTRKDIAKAVGYNESYLSHIFSDALKTTLTDYIISLRINDALPMLSATTLTVSQIALSLGFGSIRSFNRAFSREMHMSPTAYRKAQAPAKGWSRSGSNKG